MPPRKKQKTAGPEADVTLISSDSSDVEMQEPIAGPSKLPPAASAPQLHPIANLNGEAGFKADLAALRAVFGGSDHAVKGVANGDSEHSVVFKVPNPANKKRNILFNAMVLRPNAYGESHAFTVWADDDLDDNVNDAIESVSDRGPIRLKDLVSFVLQQTSGKEAVAGFKKLCISSAPRSLQKGASGIAADDEDEEDSDYDTMDAHDDLFGLSNLQRGGPDPAVMKQLRNDFRGIIGAKYRPGYCHLPDGTHVVSISTKVSEIGVEPRALHAWDAKLLVPNTYLVLLIAFDRYPISVKDYAAARTTRVVVGLSPKAKPSKSAIASAFRSHSSMSPWTEGEIEAFALTSPLATTMKDCFHQALSFRLFHDGIGWAGAEKFTINVRPGVEVKYLKKKAQAADKEEEELDYRLPDDPLAKGSTKENLPLIVWAFFLRRFIMSPRFCLICHRSLEDVTIKPYVCTDALCLFQYMSLNLGPSVEYEIMHNSSAVDILIQLAYFSSFESEMPDKMLPPTEMNLRVPKAGLAAWKPGDEETAFETLATRKEKLEGIATLINHIPPVAEMQKWLTGANLTVEEQKSAKARKLADMKDGSVPPSAWDILRWIVASNTSYLREIDEVDLMLDGIPRTYRQFRFITGDPSKETVFRKEMEKNEEEDANASRYPSLFAFHGSACKNWHSILREGLHFSKTTNGRAYGHGVYFALQGDISLGHYATATAVSWKNSEFPATKIAALCEIVNAPKKFASSNPYLVVPNMAWIQTRYLMVQAAQSITADEPDAHAGSTIALDPKFPITLHQKVVKIPDLVPKLERVYSRGYDEADEDVYSPSDLEIIREASSIIEIDSEVEKEEDYEPFAPKFLAQVRTLPPPKSAGSAGAHIQRAIKEIMKAQEKESPQKLGFYFDPSTTNDNMFHWIVEMIGFDPDLPLAKDMVKHDVKGILFEVLFPATFPFAPPFFRVIAPRFLPFAHGGGGHVTAGGSICMDLLTTDGWTSAYNIQAVLLQIKMAISSTEPRPARLDPQQWSNPYSVPEAVEGFKRAAATHGWSVPAGLDKLANGQF